MRLLDDSYYAFLENISRLRSSVTSLQRLSTLTDDLCHQFTTETDRVEGDTAAHLADLNGLIDRRATIERLACRLRAGREKVGLLGERLDQVQERVTEWARREAEWQGKIQCRCCLSLPLIRTATLPFT